jgi:hypothetical protein
MTPPSSHSFSMGQNGLAYYTARCLADVCRFSLVVGLSPGWHLAVVVGVFVRPLQCYLVVKLSHLLAAAAAHDVSADTCVEYQVALPPSQRLLRCPCTARLLTLTNQIVGCWVSATRISCWIHCAPDDVDGSANASRLGWVPRPVIRRGSRRWGSFTWFVWSCKPRYWRWWWQLTVLVNLMRLSLQSKLKFVLK